jgi:ankyrin repeat protein
MLNRPEKPVTSQSAVISKGVTLLHIAALNGQPHILRRLLRERLVDVNAQTWSHGATALYFAAQKGFTEICGLLLENGANADIPNKVN